jgi:hypothetical protein
MDAQGPDAAQRRPLLPYRSEAKVISARSAISEFLARGTRRWLAWRMNTLPTGDSIPDDPHLANDIGVPDTPARDMETAQDTLGASNAGQRVPSAGDTGDTGQDLTGAQSDLDDVHRPTETN